MENFNDRLMQLNFHDSWIDSVLLLEDGSLNIEIDYYNWEGNNTQYENWVTKKLVLKVKEVLHFKFSDSGLADGAREIYDHELIDLEEDSLEQFYANSNISNSVAVRFLTHSFGNPIVGDSKGQLEIIGLNAELFWGQKNIGSPIHIPATKEEEK